MEGIVRLIMLKNGTQLISKVDSLGTTLIDPFIVQLVPTPQGQLGTRLMALLILSSDSAITISRQEILFDVTPEKNLLSQYEDMVVHYHAEKSGITVEKNLSKIIKGGRA